MKNNKLFKAATLLMALTLITSCFVSGTFAKYTTTGGGKDSARVAKFGVTVDASTDTFSASYDGSNVTVESQGSDKVIAPGTSGTAVTFTISGTSEVKVKMTVTLGDDLTMVTLPAGDYSDYTTSDSTDTYNLSAAYNPVKWTLTKDGSEVTGCKDVALSKIEDYLKTISVQYAAGTALAGTYTLNWNWAYAGQNDKADTTLGHIAAGDETAPAGYSANESFKLSITIEQVN